MHKIAFGAFLVLMSGAALAQTPPLPTPTDVKPASITSEDIPYPYPTALFPVTQYWQDLRMSYMDVAPQGTPNGHTVVLLHGNNFAGFYWGSTIEALRKEGFRVVVPDQIGYGRSSKALIPYNFHDMARNTAGLLGHLKITKVMAVGHSMGGMAAARFASQYPDLVERLVLYNPIGVQDGRFNGRPQGKVDDAAARNVGSTYQDIAVGIRRYVAHDPSQWNAEFEKYTRYRYAWTLSADWPHYAKVQAMIGQMLAQDPVINDWAHIKAPTLLFGGAEDVLAGPANVFQERMKFIAGSIPNGNGKLHLIPGLGHVPHLEAPEKTYPPLIAFLKEGAGTK
jgi:pimeloyl-ACP methyl ester carboxylesterase